MLSDDRGYYLERARQALELSARAVDPAIAGIHLEMHDRYMERADAFAFHVPTSRRAATNRA